VRPAEQLRRRTRRRGERPGAGPSSSLSAQRAEMVPVVVPVEGRSGEDSGERGRSRNLTQVRWRPTVSEDSRGDHSSPSNRLRTCRSPVRVGAGGPSRMPWRCERGPRRRPSFRLPELSLSNAGDVAMLECYPRGAPGAFPSAFHRQKRYPPACRRGAAPGAGGWARLLAYRLAANAPTARVICLRDERHATPSRCCRRHRPVSKASRIPRVYAWENFVRRRLVGPGALRIRPLAR